MKECWKHSLPRDERGPTSVACWFCNVGVIELHVLMTLMQLHYIFFVNYTREVHEFLRKINSSNMC